MEQLKALLNLAWRNKGKFVLLLSSTLVFAFLLFPFNDLNDFITAFISKQTNGKVYVQFEQLHMSVVPTPGVALEDIKLEAPGLAGLKIREIIFTPGLSSLISKRPAGTLTTRGLFNGDLEVSLKSGRKTDEGNHPREEITIKAQKLSLGELKQLGSFPFVAQGNISLNGRALIQSELREQPEVDVELQVEQFQPLSAQTPIGPLAFPDLKISNVQLKGRLSAGKFIIEKGTIGKETDELRGTITGNMDIRFLRPDSDAGVIIPQFGAYSLDIDLKIKKSFRDRASTMLSLMEGFFSLNNHKIETANEVQYRFKVQGSDFYGPPSVSALR